MQINVSARHTELRPDHRDLILEKITRIGAKFLEMDRADVHFFEERNPRIRDKEVCEVTLEGHGHHVRVTANGPDHVTAVDRAIEKLESKLRKLKTKLYIHRTHREATRAKQREFATGEIDAELLADFGPGATTVATATVAVDGQDPDVAHAEVAVADDDHAPLESPRIVKTKTVENMLLTPVDAAVRMELVGHSFYFFTNVETNRPAVVYRRDDGDVGLIDEAG